MNCDEVRDRLLETLDAAPAGTEVEGHLGGCPACRAEAESFRRTIGLVAGLREDPAPPPSPPRFEDVLVRTRAVQSVRPRPTDRLLRAAVLLLAMGAGALGDRLATRAGPEAERADRTPPAPASNDPPATADSEARTVLAAHPGGLAASLAVIGALDSGSEGRPRR